jgi:hypothetical protein
LRLFLILKFFISSWHFIFLDFSTQIVATGLQTIQFLFKTVSILCYAIKYAPSLHMMKNLSKTRKILIAIVVASGMYMVITSSKLIPCKLDTAIFLSAFFSNGLLLSIQPTFYPSEAESKGATPLQVS